MKRKKIFKKIVVSMLTLAIMCSNIPVSAGSLPDEELKTVTVEAPAPEEPEEETSSEIENPAGSEQSGPSVPENGIKNDASTPEPPADPVQAPGTDKTPDTEQPPEIDETPDTEQPPETDETPDTEQPPETDETPDTEQPPEADGTPDTEQPAEPDPEEEFVEEDPMDYENQTPIEEASTLPDAEGTVATIWKARAARSMLFSLYNLEAPAADEIEKKAWTFDAYYVNQQDPYNVTKTSNFDLKYQMEFHANQDLVRGAVLIRINAALYRDRNGNLAVPAEIAVPEGTLEHPVQNRTTPFNYFIEYEKDGEGNDLLDQPKYLVFFNYKKIPSGSNAAWQVLYKNQKLMNIVDETPWTLTPQISVDTGAELPTEDNPYPAKSYSGLKDEDFENRTALTGRINSSVNLTSVVKSPYSEPGRNYTPGLYTQRQVERYINGTVPNTYLKDGKLDTAKWRFAVWDVKIQGTATQKWSLRVQDLPTLGLEETTDGVRVIGFKDHSDPTTSYRLRINAPKTEYDTENFQEVTLLTNREDESWGCRFYVVTAYPADRVAPGTVVRNAVEVTADPFDSIDPNVVRTSTPAEWSYRDYNWSHEGDVLGIRKQNGIGTEDNTVYTGWLDAYRVSGGDYGEIPFSTTSTFYGYSYTHRTTSGSEGGTNYTTGDYIPGRYYTHTTVDDVLYLYNEKTGAIRPMTGDDYYFSDVTIVQTDYGYDVWEDETRSSDLARVNRLDLPQGVFDRDGGALGSAVRIYAMLGNPNATSEEKTDNDGWTLVDTRYIDPISSQLTIRFSEIPGLLEQQPYRVKVEHDSIDYESTCRIDVKVCLKGIEKGKTQVMSDILNEHQNVDKKEAYPRYRLENLSGNMCHVYTKTGEDAPVEVAFAGQLTTDKTMSSNYQEPGLVDITRTLYPTEFDATNDKTKNRLLNRDQATRDLTWLSQTAEANKESKVTNDVNNNRVLVDYYLTAYDGYEIYDRSCLDYLNEYDREELISPGRTHVVFYDLLPYGMQYDASTDPTAGRITELDTNGYYKNRPGNWSKTQVQVVVDPDKDIVTDYRGTGRTMVAFHVIFSGAESASYTAQKWIEGWGVSFRAYFDWKDISQINNVDINSNLCAFMPDFKDPSNFANPELCGLKSEVDYDDGTHGDGDTERPNIEAAYEDMVKSYTVKKDDGTEEVFPEGNIDGIRQVQITKADGTTETKDIDGTYRTVIYAKNTLSSNVATASSSKIETLVHADADLLGSFGPIATVPVSATADPKSKMNLYTYDNTVTVDSDTTNIVIFNLLEHAAADRGSEDPFYKEFDFSKQWSGTFRGIDTSGFKKLGITEGTYTVYYNVNHDAQVTMDGEDPAKVLIGDNGWYTETEFIKHLQEEEKDGENWQQYVGAVAVDLKDNVVEASNSVSFRIQMTAPVTLTEGQSIYTYNNARFSSKPADGDGTRHTVIGNSVRVAVGEPQKLDVIKRTSGAVPSALLDETFEFHIYETYYTTEDGEQVENRQDLAYTRYHRYQWNKQSGKWEELRDQPYATNGNGYLYLHADERAEFDVVDAGRLKVEETPNVFWEQQILDRTTKSVDGRQIGASDGDRRTYTVTNVYRPVLYVQKSISSVPEGVNLTEADRTFTFRIRTRPKGSNGDYHALAGAEYWVVDSVRLNGGVPTKLRAGKTNGNGEFTIKTGEIIALFPGIAETQYELSEKEEAPDGNVWNWHCENPVLTGKLPSGGDSRTITNYYRWKDLLLKKEITHQTKEEYEARGQAFKFRLFEAELDEKGELKKDANGDPVPVKRDKSEIYTTEGLQWVLLNENGEEPSGSTTENPGGEPSGGTTEDSSADSGQNDGTDTNLSDDSTENSGEGTGETPPAPAEQQTSGKLSETGTFTCRAGYRTVKVKGLEAGKVYILQELPDGIATDRTSGRPLYVPDNDRLTVTMPIYSTQKDTVITNDYQMRPLSVTKTVVSPDGSNGSGTTDVPPDGGNGSDPAVVSADSDGGSDPADVPTDGDGGSDPADVPTNGNNSSNTPEYQFKVTIRRLKVESGTFEEVSVTPDIYTATTQEGGSRQIQLNADGTFSLRGGETVVFENFGMLGDQFEVEELNNTNQIYPPEHKSFPGTLSGDGGEASFVNGQAGCLLISKDYIGQDDVGKALVEEWKKIEIFGSIVNALQNPHESFVKFILNVTVNGEPYTEQIQASCVSQKTGTQMDEPYWIQPGEPTVLMPWYTVVIPVGEGDGKIPSNAVYTLEEVEESRHRIERWDRMEVTSGPDGTVGDQERKTYYMQIDQSAASESLLLAKSVSERPAATIYNEVRALPDFTGSQIGKWMTTASDEVPVGAKLMWKVEKYEGGNWSPVDGISYAVFTREGAPVSAQVETTKADGLIPLVKTAEGFPMVWFTEDTVYVNLYDTTIVPGPPKGKFLLRVVEVPKESDSAWGRLAGYVSKPENTGGGSEPRKAQSRGMVTQHNMNSMNQLAPPYSMSADPKNAVGFMNSNVSASLEIEKQMTAASETKFTMILRQVLSTNEPVNDKDDIIADGPAVGIPYTIYGTEEGGVTGPNGEIELKAGQRAVLNVPDGTMWTVSEQTSLTPTYRLASLDPEDGRGSDKLKKLNQNLMLVNLPASEKYTLIFDDNGGSGGPGVLAQTFKEAQNQVTFTIPAVEPQMRGHKFLGWSANRQSAVADASYKAGKPVVLGNGIRSQTLYAVWEEQNSITYINGDHNNGTVTEYFSGNSTLVGGVEEKVVGGYIFKGWSLDSNATTVEFQDGDTLTTLEKNTTLYAVWKTRQICTVSYIDGVTGENIFYDSEISLFEGEPTPSHTPVISEKFKGTIVFMGWDPGINPIVDADDANGKVDPNNNGYPLIQYTARLSHGLGRVYWNAEDEIDASVDNIPIELDSTRRRILVKPDWYTRKVDGKPREYDLAGVVYTSEPASTVEVKDLIPIHLDVENGYAELPDGFTKDDYVILVFREKQQ